MLTGQRAQRQSLVQMWRRHCPETLSIAYTLMVIRLPLNAWCKSGLLCASLLFTLCSHNGYHAGAPQMFTLKWMSVCSRAPCVHKTAGRCNG